jgi:hypothetical protein
MDTEHWGNYPINIFRAPCIQGPPAYSYDDPRNVLMHLGSLSIEWVSLDQGSQSFMDYLSNGKINAFHHCNMLLGAGRHR